MSTMKCACALIWAFGLVWCRVTEGVKRDSFSPNGQVVPSGRSYFRMSSEPGDPKHLGLVPPILSARVPNSCKLCSSAYKFNNPSNRISAKVFSFIPSPKVMSPPKHLPQQTLPQSNTLCYRNALALGRWIFMCNGRKMREGARLSTLNSTRPHVSHERSNWFGRTGTRSLTPTRVSALDNSANPVFRKKTQLFADTQDGVPLGHARRDDVRNVAIIAHVDHGKTTLVDALLKEVQSFEKRGNITERVMDSNAQEISRGITILAKNTAIDYKNVKINIVDTPGHADFGGEVERVMNMVDSVLLLVDAVEGPKPQTKFVLKNAIKNDLYITLVINKVDRETANPDKTLQDTVDMILDMDPSDKQLNFKTVYTSALHGKSGYSIHDIKDNMSVLLDELVSTPGPYVHEKSEPFQMIVSSIIRDPYKGALAVGRVNKGTLAKGDSVVVLNEEYAEAFENAKDRAGAPEPEGVESAVASPMNKESTLQFDFRNDAELVKRVAKLKSYNVSEISVFSTYDRNYVKSVCAGDIAIVAGIIGGATFRIGDTLATRLNPVPLKRPYIGEPTVGIVIGPNRSPLAGKDRQTLYTTSQQLRERLYREAQNDVALNIFTHNERKQKDGDKTDQSVKNRGGNGNDANLAISKKGDELNILGRGQMHLTVLLHNMRTEGYEFIVTPPNVLEKKINGYIHEPYDLITCDIDNAYVGKVMRELQNRCAEQILVDSPNESEANSSPTQRQTTHLVYRIPTRFTIGLRSKLLSCTRGTGVIEMEFESYRRHSKKELKRTKGSVLSTCEGTVSSRGATHMQTHGDMFVHVGQEVYKDMICGISSVAQDIKMNVARDPHLTNIRCAGKDKGGGLADPIPITIDSAIEYIFTGEVVEITPSYIRMAKQTALAK